MTAILTKSVVAVQRESRIAETIPSGATVEVSESSPNGWFEIFWNGLWFSVFREDFLDASAAAEVWRAGGSVAEDA
jgi:hypothetical protein